MEEQGLPWRRAWALSLVRVCGGAPQQENGLQEYGGAALTASSPGKWFSWAVPPPTVRKNR